MKHKLCFNNVSYTINKHNSSYWLGNLVYWNSGGVEAVDRCLCVTLREVFLGPVNIVHVDACCFMILNDFTHLKACLCFRILLCRCPFLYCAGSTWSLKTLLFICEWALIHRMLADVSCLKNVTLPRKCFNLNSRR